MKKTKKLLSLVIAILLSMASINHEPVNTVQAASKYITVKEFAKALATECKLKPVDKPLVDGYVDALMVAGIIKDGDFTKYTANLTRGDATVLIGRADEYLNKPKIKESLIQTVIDKRITDIDKIKKAKRTDFAKGYIRGYLKGYSDGTYTSTRTMKVKSKVTKDGALNMIKMLRNSSLRAKISPDGQLIRTTNLPKYAKYFPYILSSYPNSYYDWQFDYELTKRYGDREDGTNGVIPYVKGIDYFSPADLAKKPTHFDKDVTDECLDMWTEKAKKYVELTFNVDYRTIGEKWVQEMFDVNFEKGDIPQNEETQKSLFRDYIPIMKKNKTIVESSMVAADRSSIYRFGHSYVVRVYVKYRILSSNVKYEDAINEKGKFYIDDHKIFNRILYSRWFTSISKFKIGQWKTGYFDILIDANQMRKSSMDLGVFDDTLSELFMKPE